MAANERTRAWLGILAASLGAAGVYVAYTSRRISAKAAAPDFSGRLVGLLNGQAVATALGVASRTGLVAALVRTASPRTAAQLAGEAMMSVRYVEEILAVLVCGQIVKLGGGQQSAATFSLPEAGHDALKSMGLYFEELPLLSQCAFRQVATAATFIAPPLSTARPPPPPPGAPPPDPSAPQTRKAPGTDPASKAGASDRRLGVPESFLHQKVGASTAAATDANGTDGNSVVEEGVEGGGGGGMSGGDVAAACYRPFSAWMGRLADEKHERQLVQTWLPALEGAGVEAVGLMKGTSGAQVCDLGCGSGTAVCLMAQAHPHSRFVGVDCDADAIASARNKAKAAHLSNVHFLVADACSLPSDWTGIFDLVTSFDAIHDLGNPAGALAEAHRITRPQSGTFAMVDIRARTDLRHNVEHPMGAFLYAVSLLHCMPQGLRGGGVGLGMMWGRERALGMLCAAGFDPQMVDMSFDPFNDCFVCRKST